MPHFQSIPYSTTAPSSRPTVDIKRQAPQLIQQDISPPTRLYIWKRARITGCFAQIKRGSGSSVACEDLGFNLNCAGLGYDQDRDETRDWKPTVDNRYHLACDTWFCGIYSTLYKVPSGLPLLRRDQTSLASRHHTSQCRASSPPSFSSLQRCLRTPAFSKETSLAAAKYSSSSPKTGQRQLPRTQLDVSTMPANWSMSSHPKDVASFRA